MEFPVPPSAVKTLASAEQTDLVKHLPSEARAALHRFQTSGDSTGLDTVICAILADFMPRRGAVPLADRPGNTRLIDDLGFDSLAITEVVFFAEDLFGITISNEEMVRVRTLDDLHGFIRQKVAVRVAR